MKTAAKRSLTQRGFTLPELVVTVALAGIVAATAVPSFQELIRENRLSGQVNDFVAVHNFARSEAIRRGQVVSLCASSDGASCAATGGFEQGWITFNEIGVRDCAVGDGEEVMRVRTALEPVVGGASQQTVTSTRPSAVRCFSYQPNGLAMGGGVGLQNGTYRFCDERQGERNSARHVVFSNTGRMQVVRAGGCQ